MKSCLVQATPVVEDLGAVHTGLLRPLHSICRDSAKKIRCRRYPDRSTAIHRADVVLFGLGLLYFPSAPAFCAGQKTAVYHVSCTENVCARALYSLWDCGGSVTLSVGSIFFFFFQNPDRYRATDTITPSKTVLLLHKTSDWLPYSNTFPIQGKWLADRSTNQPCSRLPPGMHFLKGVILRPYKDVFLSWVMTFILIQYLLSICHRDTL